MMPLSVTDTAVVMYHANCTDGFGAAWAFESNFSQNYSGGVVYVPCEYNKPIPEFSVTLPGSTDIYILDFSFDRDTILKLADTYGSVTVLDHHKTALKILGNWDHGRADLQIVFDMDRSGAGIAWDFFALPETNRPRLINYIEDRDLWTWQLPDSRVVSALIGYTKKEFSAYDNLHILLENYLDRAVAMGTILSEQQERHVNSILAACKQPIIINGVKGLVCNCPGQFASDVGEQLAKESGTFGATYFTQSDGSVKFSLRSAGDFNVLVLAEKFGGGGHDKAAGFVLTDPIGNALGTGVTLYNIQSEDDFPDDYEV